MVDSAFRSVDMQVFIYLYRHVKLCQNASFTVTLPKLCFSLSNCLTRHLQTFCKSTPVFRFTFCSSHGKHCCKLLESGTWLSVSIQSSKYVLVCHRVSQVSRIAFTFFLNSFTSINTIAQIHVQSLLTIISSSAFSVTSDVAFTSVL